MAQAGYLQSRPQKFNRSYTEAELALFARHVAEREEARPKCCSGGVRCWVVHGPPAYRTNGPAGFCVECEGAPIARPGR